MQNAAVKMKLPTNQSVIFAVSLFSLTTWSPSAWSVVPYNEMSIIPLNSGFSPWSMGSNPWSSGFSPWSMGSNPWSSGFSPWSMGSNPWSSGFSPWGGNNAWNSSIWPWSSRSGWGNSWGNNSWLPWSNGSGFSGRRNNNDWVTSMFLMNSLNDQQLWNAGMLPNYPYPAPVGNQSFPAQQPQTLFYPAPISPVQTTNSPSTNPASTAQSTLGASNFPAATASFSPFLDTIAPNNSGSVMTSPQHPVTPASSPNLTGKTLVFPDGSHY